MSSSYVNLVVAFALLSVVVVVRASRVRLGVVIRSPIAHHQCCWRTGDVLAWCRPLPTASRLSLPRAAVQRALWLRLNQRAIARAVVPSCPQQAALTSCGGSWTGSWHVGWAALAAVSGTAGVLSCAAATGSEEEEERFPTLPPTLPVCCCCRLAPPFRAVTARAAASAVHDAVGRVGCWRCRCCY